MKTKILLVMILLLMPFAFAKPLFSNWVTDRDNLTIERVNYTISLSTDRDTLSIPMLGLRIGRGDCENTPEYSICFNETRFNFSADQGSYDKNERELHQAHITVEKVEHQLTIERQLSTQYIPLNGIETVYVTLNPNETIRDVKYSDVLPEGLKLLNGLGVTIEGQKVSAEFRGIDNPVQFSYNIQLLNESDMTLNNATAIYTYNNTEKIARAPTLNITYSLRLEEVNATKNTTSLNKTINSTVQKNTSTTEKKNFTNSTNEPIKDEIDEGFFTKYIKNPIKRFFSWIFG